MALSARWAGLSLPIKPYKAYLVNERGTEILMGASGTVLSNSQSRRMLEGAGGGNHYYSIDARGTDPVLTGQRTGPRSSVPTIPLLGRR